MRKISLLFFIFGVFLFVLNVLGQIPSTPSRDSFDRLEQRQKLREELHQRMRDSILHGLSQKDQEWFDKMDQMMDQAMRDMADMSLTTPGLKTDTMSFGSQFFSSEWKEDDKSRMFIVTPKNKDTNLNIDVSKGMITIKGQVQNGSFSNSLSVPEDVDADLVKIDGKNGKITLIFPYKTTKKAPTPSQIPKPKRDDRRPLAPQNGDIEV